MSAGGGSIAEIDALKRRIYRTETERTPEVQLGPVFS
jgi:hypothetical protein